MTAAHDPTGSSTGTVAADGTVAVDLRAVDPSFPFDAVVGMVDAKLALQLVAVDPLIGGVLLRGQKGSAKTTLARGLAALLANGSFVDLPLGTTEDRLIGSLDLGRALAASEVAFRPGLLARADGGVLYVDEINLLPDHLVDLLLDVAASGVNRVEREGVSHQHPARFVLVGSMNPEEGELRPQLLDRFGLSVEVVAATDREARVAAVYRRLAHDGARVEPTDGMVDSVAMSGAGSGSQPADLARRLARTRPALIGRGVIESASNLALAAGAEGLRADLVLCRAAAALAGLEGRGASGADDLRRVAPLVLGHRARTGPFDHAAIPEDQVRALVDSVLGPADRDGESGPGPRPGPGAGPYTDTDAGAEAGPGADTGVGAEAGGRIDAGRGGDPGRSDGGGSPPARFGGAGPGDPGPGAGAGGHGGSPVGAGGRRLMEPGGERPIAIPSHLDRPVTAQVTNRVGAIGTTAGGGDLIETGRGRFVRDVPAEPGSGRPMAVVATVRRLAEQRRAPGSDDPVIRQAVRVARSGRLLVLAVDTSGSMGAVERARAATGAALGLLTDSYQRRDRVGLVTFGGDGADVVLRPTGSVEIARHRLAELSTGGASPLAEGIAAALSVARSDRDPSRRPLLVLLTDGRATGGPDALDRALAAAAGVAAAGIDGLVLDCESDAVPRLGLAGRLADAMAAPCLAAATMEAEHLVSLIRRTAGKGGIRP